MLAWLRAQRSAGRRLVLVVDEDSASAQAIASHLDLFDEIAGTGDYQGTVSERRRCALVTRFGERGFDYAGSDAGDRIVWDAARRAIIVGDARISRGMDHNTAVEMTFGSQRYRFAPG